MIACFAKSASKGEVLSGSGEPRSRGTASARLTTTSARQRKASRGREELPGGTTVPRGTPIGTPTGTAGAAEDDDAAAPPAEMGTALGKPLCAVAAVAPLTTGSPVRTASENRDGRSAAEDEEEEEAPAPEDVSLLLSGPCMTGGEPIATTVSSPLCDCGIIAGTTKGRTSARSLRGSGP